MFKTDEFSGLRIRIIKLLETFFKNHPNKDSKLPPLELLSADSWLDIAYFFGDSVRLSIMNHGLTWEVVPPWDETTDYGYDEDLLPLLHYTNWTHKHTERFKNLLNNSKVVLTLRVDEISRGNVKPRPKLDWEL